MGVTIRLRTKDGTERLDVEPDVLLPGLIDAVAKRFGLHPGAVSVTRDGPGREPLPADRPLGLQRGDLVFLHYSQDREPVARFEEKDPFKRFVQNGELRKQGSTAWTLTSYLDFRSQREFKLGKAPDAHCLFVSVDARAGNNFLANMQAVAFACQRVGLLYGRFTDDGGVQVDVIYEPPQECTDCSIQMDIVEVLESKAHKVATFLGLHLVGWIFAHPPRAHTFTINEIILGAQLQAKALQQHIPWPSPGAAAEGDLAERADGSVGGGATAGSDGGEVDTPARRFVTLKARLVTEGEAIEGVATVEAYQVTDQCVSLVQAGAIKQSTTDARCAKTVNTDCVFVIEQKESRKATAEHFVSRVHDMSRPYESPLSTTFPVENRPTQPQTQQSLREHLVRRRGEPFHLVTADFHLLLFVSNLLDMSTEMPVFCHAVAEGDSSQLEGFQVMLNAFAEIE